MEKFLPIKKMQEFLKELGDLMPTDQKRQFLIKKPLFKTPLKTLTSITTPRYMSYQLSTSKAFWICSSSNNVSYCLFYCFFINVFHKSYCRFDRSFDIVSDKFYCLNGHSDLTCVKTLCNYNLQKIVVWWL